MSRDKHTNHGREVRQEVVYHLPVAVVGAGIGGCEFARKFYEENPEVPIVIYEAGNDILSKTSKAMAGRMSPYGSHYTDKGTRDYYSMCYEKMTSSWYTSPVFGGSIERPQDRAKFDTTLMHYSADAQNGEGETVRPQENVAVYALAVASNDPKGFDQIHYGGNQYTPASPKIRSGAVSKMVTAGTDGVLDHDFIKAKYKQWIDTTENINLVARSWVHSFLEIKFIQREKTHAENVKALCGSIKPFIGQFLADAELRDRYPMIMDAFASNDGALLSVAEAVLAAKTDGFFLPSFTIVIGVRRADSGEYEIFLEPFSNLIVTAYDGNRRVIERSNLAYCKPERRAMDHLVPTDLRRSVTDSQMHYARLKVALVLEKGGIGAITVAQGPFAAILGEYLTAEYVTNLPLERNARDEALTAVISSVAHGAVHTDRLPILRTWIQILGETMYLDRTPIVDSVSKSCSKSSHLAVPACKQQYDYVKENFAKVNQFITRKTGVLYWALLISEFHRLVRDDRDNMSDYFGLFPPYMTEQLESGGFKYQVMQDIGIRNNLLLALMGKLFSKKSVLSPEVSGAYLTRLEEIIEHFYRYVFLESESLNPTLLQSLDDLISLVSFQREHHPLNEYLPYLKAIHQLSVIISSGQLIIKVPDVVEDQHIQGIIDGAAKNLGYLSELDEEAKTTRESTPASTPANSRDVSPVSPRQGSRLTTNVYLQDYLGIHSSVELSEDKAVGSAQRYFKFGNRQCMLAKFISLLHVMIDQTDDSSELVDYPLVERDLGCIMHSFANHVAFSSTSDRVDFEIKGFTNALTELQKQIVFSPSISEDMLDLQVALRMINQILGDSLDDTIGEHQSLNAKLLTMQTGVLGCWIQMAASTYLPDVEDNFVSNKTELDSQAVLTERFRLLFQGIIQSAPSPEAYQIQQVAHNDRLSALNIKRTHIGSTLRVPTVDDPKNNLSLIAKGGENLSIDRCPREKPMPTLRGSGLAIVANIKKYWYARDLAELSFEVAHAAQMYDAIVESETKQAIDKLSDELPVLIPALQSVIAHSDQSIKEIRRGKFEQTFIKVIGKAIALLHTANVYKIPEPEAHETLIGKLHEFCQKLDDKFVYVDRFEPFHVILQKDEFCEKVLKIINPGESAPVTHHHGSTPPREHQDGYSALSKETMLRDLVSGVVKKNQGRMLLVELNDLKAIYHTKSPASMPCASQAGLFSGGVGGLLMSSSDTFALSTFALSQLRVDQKDGLKK